MRILNSPIRVAGIELPNRLVLPPMATAKSSGDGKISEALCAYYADRADGGRIGLIIVEHSYVSPEGKASNGQLSIAGDADIAGLEKLVATIHESNTKVFAQLNHAGGAARTEITGRAPLGPSAVALPPPRNCVPCEMSLRDIEKAIRDFADAARRAKRAGFDGVELHSAHGYLLNQFLSPLTNRRSDRYGGESVQERIRLHLEIIGEVRRAVGADYPLALRLGACDYMAGGTTVEDGVAAAQAFERAGVDLLDISGGFCMYTHPDSREQGYFSALSEPIKRAVHIPVILTGGIVDANAAERLLEEGKADMIGVGRAMMKDPGWARRAMPV